MNKRRRKLIQMMELALTAQLRYGDMMKVIEIINSELEKGEDA